MSRLPRTKTRPKPALPWQTGEFARHQDLYFVLPYHFLLLCKLMEVTPQQLLIDFMDNLSCASWRREGREHARTLVVDYFIGHGYGRQHYTESDIRTMFQELDALGMLFPHNGPEQLRETYLAWRDHHQAYWFEKWFNLHARSV